MDLTLLKNLGLTEAEIKIYSTLLENGELPAHKIISETGLKKGDCYNKIYDLIAKGLVIESGKNKKKHFSLEHPNKIEDLVEAQYQSVHAAKKEVAGLLPDLISTFNLAYHKPGVKMFEGEEGLRIIMEDTLKSGDEILSFIDIGMFHNLYTELNARYLKKRYDLKINKKNLLPKSEASKAYIEKNKSQFTEFRYLETAPKSLGISMNIYGDKISLQTYKKGSLISIIIEDAIIVTLFRSLYQSVWQQAAEI